MRCRNWAQRLLFCSPAGVMDRSCLGQGMRAIAEAGFYEVIANGTKMGAGIV